MTKNILIESVFLRLGVIYGHTWTSRHVDSENWELSKDVWANALRGISKNAIKNALDDLTLNGENFPPSLPVFVKICLSHSGVLSEEESFNAFVKRDVSNPLVSICNTKLGGHWLIGRDSDKALRKKFSIAYQEALKQVVDDKHKLLE